MPLTAPLPQANSDNLNPGLVVPAASDSYQIGPGDVLSIFVYQMPEMTGQMKVDPQGEVSLPFLQQKLKVADETGPQVADLVAADLVRSGLARNPQVRVVVREVASRLLVVTGAVQRPTVLEMDRPLTMAEAIARAGGLSEEAGDTVRISKRNAEGTGSSQEMPLTPILRGQATGPQLSGNETLEVEPARMVYVMGAVTKAGAFPLRAGEPVTVLRALAMAQGFAGQADKKHARVLVPSGPGAPQMEITVNLEQILKHRAPDRTLAAGEVLFVPESGRDKILGMAMNTSLQTLALAVGYNASHIF